MLDNLNNTATTLSRGMTTGLKSSLECSLEQRHRPLIDLLDMARPLQPSGLKVCWGVLSGTGLGPRHDPRGVLVGVRVVLVVAGHADIVPCGLPGVPVQSEPLMRL